MTLVIGIGSLLHGDDAAGRLAARALGGREVVQLTPELAEDVAAAEAVLFLDAAPDASEVEVVAVRAGSPEAGSHAATPSSLLGLANALYGRVPERCALLRIPATRLDVGEGLSPQAAAAVRRAVALGTQWVSA
ncbi:MAG TPA: hydrogenase maturation protease [Myxococcales bacterium]|nr:hydrogenase maturation protease [Myxococcales bacterium]